MSNQIRGATYSMTLGGMMTRFVAANFILFTIAFFTPSFEMVAFFTLILSAMILSLFDYLVNAMIGIPTTPFIQGVIAFTVATTVLTITGFFLPNLPLSLLSVVMGSLLYALVAAITPSRKEE